MDKLYAAFGEFEIPCSIGDPTVGWIPPERRVRFKIDPILGNICMLKNSKKLLVIVSLDVLFLDTCDAEVYRNAVAQAVGTDPSCVSICSTHNHAGPAITTCYDADKNPALVAEVQKRLCDTCLELVAKLQPAVLGCGVTYENDITWNRRYILKNGYTFAHPNPDTMDIVCAEGPIDPQVGVICVRDMEGLALGYVVNFACHPIFYGGMCIASPNFPGELRKELKKMERQECVTVFLNGAAGDISHVNPFDPKRTTAHSVGKQLAVRSYEVAMKTAYTSDVELNAIDSNIDVYKRHIDDAHIARAQRVVNGENDLEIDPCWHPVSSMPNQEFAQKLIELREDADKEPTLAIPVQALRIGESVWGFCPCELFNRFGMEIKVNSPRTLTFVAAYANGMCGYVFHKEAQMRGGYESTPCGGSITDYRAGDKIVDALGQLIKEIS